MAPVKEFVSLHRLHSDHLSAEGVTDPVNLRARARSRAKIFNHAKTFEKLNPNVINEEDWQFFSDYSFLLARQCALQDLIAEARAMVTISIESIGKKTMKHKFYLKLVKFVGWQNASKFLAKLGK